MEYQQNDENLAETASKTRIFFSRRQAPCRIVIQKSVQKSLNTIVASGARKTQELWLKILSIRNLWLIAAVFGSAKSFFENRAGATVTVNVLRYREMFNDFLWPDFDDIDLDNVFF